MVVAVAEVVNVVSLDGIDAIIYGALECPLARPGEICLKSRCSCVEDTDSIGIVCPCLTECFFEVFREFLKRLTKRLTCNTHSIELLMSYVPTEHRLHDISTVKAVHAVNSYISDLLIGDLTGTLIQLFSAVKTEVESCHEIVEAMEFVLHLLDQLRKVLPLHLPAFVVEVEPYILDKLIFNLVNNLSELSADAKLRPFLVYQIDKDLLAI